MSEDRKARDGASEAPQNLPAKAQPVGGKPLSERKKLILNAIVDAHITDGEPIGSKYLMQNKHIGYSSATIRNEMAELEDMGYLEQPHTSAGRVPTEAGYRFYVDSLVDRYNFTAQEIERLENALTAKRSELGDILTAGMRIASSMTNYTALAVRGAESRITVSRFEIMRLDSRNLVLVMVLPDTTVKTKHVRSSFDIPEEAVTRLSSVLNARLTGLAADAINLPKIMELERAMGEYDYLVSPVIKGVFEEVGGGGDTEIMVEGVNRLLSYPDFYDNDRLGELLAMFERKSDLGELIPASTDGEKSLQVYIGSENAVKLMDSSSLVIHRVSDGGRPIGAIAVIGPKRMDYRRVISVLEGLSDGIGHIIAEGKDDKEDST